MLNDKQLENLLYELSSFYRDFLPVNNNLEKLFKVYAHTIGYVWEQYQEAGDSRFVSTTRTLSTIPYFKVSIEDALYDLSTARILARKSFDEQIAYLDKERKFASFVFQEKDAAGDPIVYSMRLFNSFTQEAPLEYYRDFFIRSNRLYLLPSYIQMRKTPVQHLHAFDIKVNDHTLEKNFGSRFSLQVGPLLPRYEYRDVLEAFIRSFKGGMTIKAIKDSIQLATKWDDFKLEDYKSPHISPRKKQLYDEWFISPFKFLVSLPEYLIPDKIKVNIIRTLLNEIREQHTDFMFFFDIERYDPYPMPMKRIPTIRYNRGDRFRPEEDVHISKSSVRVVDNPFDLFGRYDSTFFYNWNLKYDDPPSNEIISVHAKGKIAKDQGKIGDQASITIIDVPVPRGFSVEKDSEAQLFNLAVKTMDSVDRYELYGSTEKNGEYTLIESTPPSSDTEVTSFTHQPDGTGYTFFRVKSVAGDATSLWSTPINITFAPGFYDGEELDIDRPIDGDKAFGEYDDASDMLGYLFGVDTINMFH